MIIKNIFGIRFTRSGDQSSPSGKKQIVVVAA
jgi:hypothetical protein